MIRIKKYDFKQPAQREEQLPCCKNKWFGWRVIYHSLALHLIEMPLSYSNSMVLAYHTILDMDRMFELVGAILLRNTIDMCANIGAACAATPVPKSNKLIIF